MSELEILKKMQVDYQYSLENYNLDTLMKRETSLGFCWYLSNLLLEPRFYRGYVFSERLPVLYNLRPVIKSFYLSWFIDGERDISGIEKRLDLINKAISIIEGNNN